MDAIYVTTHNMIHLGTVKMTGYQLHRNQLERRLKKVVGKNASLNGTVELGKVVTIPSDKTKIIEAVKRGERPRINYEDKFTVYKCST